MVQPVKDSPPATAVGQRLHEAQRGRPIVGPVRAKLQTLGSAEGRDAARLGQSARDQRRTERGDPSGDNLGAQFRLEPGFEAKARRDHAIR